MAELVPICGVDDLSDGGLHKVEVLGCEYLVIQRGEETHVLDAACTNDWADLSTGSLEGEIVTCPQCGGQFDITTGAVVREPPTFPLDTYNVEVREGGVYSDVTGY